MNIIGIWYNLFRALEIAKLGNFSVSVHFDHEYTKGFEDYKTIKEFCIGWFENFVEDGNIKVELHKPESYELKGNYETLNDIQNRINEALLCDLPEYKSNIVQDNFIKTAVSKLDLSLKQVENIKRIAGVIARLDKSKDIKIEHVAEAIQYSYTFNDFCGEFEAQNFGPYIVIKNGIMETIDIKNAINHLTKLL